MKNLDQLDPERPRNTITAHALKAKLKRSDVRKTLSLHQRRPQDHLNCRDAKAVQNYLKP